ncbi:DUF6753 family protein [Floridanema evergladense]|uniref:DUF6753 family protein n=1 Tax=Floridaenema evergladense BLCC-F167 TaxID=3153639 RepID=A0ABV4WHG0_9CYAN
MNSNYSDPSVLLEKVLEGKSEDFKRKVWDFVKSTDLSPDDPAIILAIAFGNVAVMVEDVPASIEETFKEGCHELQRALHLAERMVVERQKAAIASAAGDLIRQTESQQSKRLFDSIIPAVGVLLGVLGLGFFMGITVPPFLQGGYTKEVKLTADEVEALRWAKSNEGKFARNLMDWNRGYLDNKTCLQDVKKLGVKLNLGTQEAVDGFCVIWTMPPQRRTFVN